MEAEKRLGFLSSPSHGGEIRFLQRSSCYYQRPNRRRHAQSRTNPFPHAKGCWRIRQWRCIFWGQGETTSIPREGYGGSKDVAAMTRVASLVKWESPKILCLFHLFPHLIGVASTNVEYFPHLWWSRLVDSKDIAGGFASASGIEYSCYDACLHELHVSLHHLLLLHQQHLRRLHLP